jgi:methionyl aminopeptidase
MNNEDKQKIIEAGKIASHVKEFAKSIIKKDSLLIEIAEKIESKIIELGGKPAFPVNTSINDVAAHYTPSHDDQSKAHGLLKIDLGVHIDGFIADTAFSIDLEDLEENKKLIESSEKALKKGIEQVKKYPESTLSEIGYIIQKTIEENDSTPIINLSGHSIDKYDLHSGITIPNVDNGSDKKLSPGLYAIEPFSTNGNGKIYDGKPSGIYQLEDPKNVRSPNAREVLEFITEEYNTLPFCKRWLVKKFGNKALLALNELMRQGILHEYDQLIETGKGKVAQSEHTILIEESQEVTVTTK